MRAGEAIEELRRCRELPSDLRLDSDCDRRVERVVRGLMRADPDELARLRRDGSREDMDLLMNWVDRASSLAVRRRDPDLLVAAIFGFGFAESSMQYDWLHLQSQLRQAARIIGRDAGEAWSAAMARSDAPGAAWLDANRGRRRFIRSSYRTEHYSDPYDGGRFRFGRPGPPSLRLPRAPTEPGRPARPDLSGVAVLGGDPDVREELESLVGELWLDGRWEDADRLVHAVLAHDAAADALNELRAALVQMRDADAAGSLLARLGSV